MESNISSEIESKCLDFEIKFAHGEGHTVFVINEKKGKLLTGGSDGEVRCWPIEQNDDDPQSYDVGSSIYSITTSIDSYYVASDSIDVKHYDLDGNYKGSAVRSTLNIYSVSLSDDHKLLASGGGDFIIKIVNLDDHSIKQISGHEAPILSLKFDPKRKYLASSSCDGSVQVWNISALDSIKNVKKFDNNHKKSNDFSNSSTLCSIAWNMEGSLLAVPSDELINFYERDLWTSKFSLKYNGFKEISICEFDRSGKYFAASNSSGVLIVWNLHFKETPISIYVNESNTLITCFKFNPTNKEKLIASDKNGQLIYIDLKQDDRMKQLDKEAEDKYGMIENSNDGFDDDEFDDAAFMRDLDNMDAKLNNKKTETTTINNNEDSEPFIPPKEKFTLSKFSNATKKKNNNRILDSDEDEDSNLDTQQTQNSNNLADIDPNVFDDDDYDEMTDLGALKQKYESKINGSFNENDKPIDNKPVNLDLEEHKIINIKVKPIMQPPFQPGSTPVQLEHRFMKWNSVGIVTCNRTEEENIIDVEFHNSDVYRPIHLPNTYNYTMADLNTDSLLLAAPAIENETNEDDSTASILFCMNFNSYDSNKEWRYQMPLNESIEAIALSSNFVLAATDQRKIRLYTSSGIQLHLFSIPGPVICLTAQENILQIIYHNGSGLPGEQSISMNVLRLNDRSVYPVTLTNQMPVALSPKSVIEWSGFTDEGNSCIVDSAGIVKLFNQKSNCWIPVVDLKSKNKNDHYFVISVSELQETIRCISCKGTKYPATIPKPDVYSIPFEIPLCELTTTKAKIEEQLIRLSLKKCLLNNLSSSGFDVDFTNEENTKKQVEILIKLFALAVNADCNSLAIEVAGLMPNQLAIEGAIRYATQKNRTVLVNRLNKLSREKFNSLNVNFANEENMRRGSRLVNSTSNKLGKRRQTEDSNEDVLRPKQIKLSNEQNPFRITKD